MATEYKIFDDYFSGTKPPAQQQAQPKPVNEYQVFDDYFGSEKPAPKPQAPKPEKKGLMRRGYEAARDYRNENIVKADEGREAREEIAKKAREGQLETLKSIPMRVGLKAGKATTGTAAGASELFGGLAGYAEDFLPEGTKGKEVAGLVKERLAETAEKNRKQYKRLTKEEAHRYGQPGVMGQTVDAVSSGIMQTPETLLKVAGGPLAWAASGAAKAKGRGEDTRGQISGATGEAVVGAALPIAAKYIPMGIQKGKQALDARKLELSKDVMAKTAQQNMSARQLRAEGYQPWKANKEYWVKQNADGGIESQVRVSPEVSDGRAGWVKQVARDAWQSIKDAPGKVYQPAPKPQSEPKMLEGQAKLKPAMARPVDAAPAPAAAGEVVAIPPAKPTPSQPQFAPKPVSVYNGEHGIQAPAVKPPTDKDIPAGSEPVVSGAISGKKIFERGTPENNAAVLQAEGPLLELIRDRVTPEQFKTFEENLPNDGVRLREATNKLIEATGGYEFKNPKSVPFQKLLPALDEITEIVKTTVPEKVPLVKKAPEKPKMDEVRKIALESLRNEIEGSKAGTRGARFDSESVGTGGSAYHDTSTRSTFPIQHTGFDKVQQLKIIDKMLNGTEPTEIQKVFVEAVNSHIADLEERAGPFAADWYKAPEGLQGMKAGALSVGDKVETPLDKYEVKSVENGKVTLKDGTEQIADVDDTIPVTKYLGMVKAQESTPALKKKITKSTGAIYKARAEMAAAGGDETPLADMDLGERFTLTGDKREWEVTADNRNQGTKVIEDGAPVTWSNEDSLPVDDFKASAPAATTPTPAAEVSAGVAEAPTGALGLSDSERGFITSDITKLITSDPELLKRDIGRVIKGVVDGWKKKHPTKAVRSVMNAWDAGQKIANYEGFLARKGLETTIPKEVRDAIPFAIEAALAKASGVDTELTHNALEATRGYEAQIDGIKRGYDQLHTLLATVKPDLAYLKGYINRVWENPDAVMAWWNIDAKAKSVRGLARESSHGRQRMIPTLEEGIAGGFIPKVTDVAELYGIYTREVYNSVNDMLVLEAMKGSGDLLPAADAPSGWFKIDLPKAGSMLGESKSGWAVSPELDHTLRVMFEPSRLRQTEGGRAYLLTQSLMKKGSFELSPFHVGALAKSTFAALEAINPFKMIEAKKRYNSGDPIIREMLKAGLEIEAPHDVGRDMYESALSVLGDRVTMLKPIGKAIKAWDIVVWDNAYLTMKVISYEAFRDALYKRYGAKKREGLVGGIKNRLFGELKDPTPKETLNEWAAEAVNAFFGGINNNRYYRTLSQRDEMRAFINSPDWVESVVWRSVTGMWDELYRNADQPFKERVRDAWRKGYSYRRYWTRVGLSFFVIANAINYKTTSADDPDGEGRFIWENPHDERMKVYAGTTDEGEAVYIDLLGFLKDPFEMIVNPVDFAQRKMATLPKTTARMLFNQNWRGDKIYYSTDTDTQSFWKLAKYFVGAGLPISIKNPYEAYAQNKPVWMAIASSFGNPIKIASSKELKARVSDLREEKGNLVFEIKLLMEKGREGKGIMDPKYYEAKQHRLILAFNRKVAKELAELGEQYEMDVFDSEETESDGTNTATPREAFEQFFLYDDKLEESYERWMNGKAVEERQKIITPNAQPSYDEMVSDEATQ